MNLRVYLEQFQYMEENHKMREKKTLYPMFVLLDLVALPKPTNRQYVVV